MQKLITVRFPSLLVYGEHMGLSKRDLGKKKANLKSRLEELEKKAKFDPIKKDRKLHEEIAELKKKLGVE